MNFLNNYIFIIFISGLISASAVPLVIKFGSKYKIVDIPDVRKNHLVPVVRIGGIALFVSITLSFFFAYFFNLIETSDMSFINLLLIASFSVFLLGLFDDVLTISPFLRLVFQIIISSVVWQKGISIDIVDLSWINSEFYFLLPKFLSFTLTVFWITAITNAFNWLDGLDGLAAGNCVVSSLGFSLIYFTTNQGTDVYLMGALIGSCMGFLIYNFYKAKIYMGDSGSYFIGFSLSLIAIHATYSSQTLIDGSKLANSVLPFFLLMLPISDMLFVIFKRIYYKKSPFLPDRNHFHHRLLNSGFNHTNSVLFSYAINQFFVGMALAIHFGEYKFPILITCLIILSTFFFNKCYLSITYPFNISIKAKNYSKFKS